MDFDCFFDELRRMEMRLGDRIDSRHRGLESRTEDHFFTTEYATDGGPLFDEEPDQEGPLFDEEDKVPLFAMELGNLTTACLSAVFDQEPDDLTSACFGFDEDPILDEGPLFDEEPDHGEEEPSTDTELILGSIIAAAATTTVDAPFKCLTKCPSSAIEIAPGDDPSLISADLVAVTLVHDAVIPADHHKSLLIWCLQPCVADVQEQGEEHDDMVRLLTRTYGNEGSRNMQMSALDEHNNSLLHKEALRLQMASKEKLQPPELCVLGYLNPRSHQLQIGNIVINTETKEVNILCSFLRCFPNADPHTTQLQCKQKGPVHRPQPWPSFCNHKIEKYKVLCQPQWLFYVLVEHMGDRGPDRHRSKCSKALGFMLVPRQVQIQEQMVLLSGALETFERYSVKPDNITFVSVPGSFDVPVTAQKLGKSGKYDVILCIGAMIRGDTTHYDVVANSAASGLLSAGLCADTPCVFGVLTCEDMDQALNRAGGKAGNKGAEAAITAIEMANEVLPVVKGVPVLAGVCATDQFCRMDYFLRKLEAIGFCGVQNFPTVCNVASITHSEHQYDATGMSTKAALKVLVEKMGLPGGYTSSLESYLKGEVVKALLLYNRTTDLGYEVAQRNAALILDRYGDQSICMGEYGFCTDMERHLCVHALWWQASEQGYEHAALLIGAAYYYGRGVARDYEKAAEAHMHAQSQSNAQAMFNLGYMHAHGHGLPLDLHLAKRYYDQVVEVDSAAKLPVMLALTSLWLRTNYADSFVVHFIDSLPEIYHVVEELPDAVHLAGFSLESFQAAIQRKCGGVCGFAWLMGTHIFSLLRYENMVGSYLRRQWDPGIQNHGLNEASHDSPLAEFQERQQIQNEQRLVCNAWSWHDVAWGQATFRRGGSVTSGPYATLGLGATMDRPTMAQI